jgi:hypothetical protein
VRQYPIVLVRVDMKVTGFNIAKSKLSYCTVAGTKASAQLVNKACEKFSPEQPAPQLVNYFKQAFSEIIGREKPDSIAYRISFEAVKASIPYLHFSFGILNLVAHDLQVPIVETNGSTFSARALGIKGDKFESCDKLINGVPSSNWNNEYRYAALAAWMALDG